MRVPALFEAETIVRQASEVRAQKGDRWVPVRSLGYSGFYLLRRLKLAWGVFTGKYDAVVWEA